ncbi:MAG: hypothetical protein IBX72_14150 [Nitrospirae bacterium]|nr:hypothetical protein [Nitrospirota bacterium]
MKNDFGWTHYSATGWVFDQGQKLYIGHFKEIDGTKVTKITIPFIARRPVVAMRKITKMLNEGVCLSKIINKEIN